MGDNEQLPFDQLKILVERATKGRWELQDGSSWRRIGTLGHDGNVLCPYNSRTDHHPDLTAGRGEDLYANLELICASVNLAKAIVSEGAVERMARAIMAEGLQQIERAGNVVEVGWDVAPDEHKDQCRALAKSALSALLDGEG